MGTVWLCLVATAVLTQGCAPQSATWNGEFAIDKVGGAKTCVAPTAAIPDGKVVLAEIQVSNEGGWCGVSANRNATAFDSYLLVTRPTHGQVFAHHVGSYTRIDYTPDVGYVGADKFSIRLLPGDAIIEGAVTVIK